LHLKFLDDTILSNKPILNILAYIKWFKLNAIFVIHMFFLAFLAIFIKCVLDLKLEHLIRVRFLTSVSLTLEITMALAARLSLIREASFNLLIVDIVWVLT
jgi:hypothetical protein